MQQIEVTDLALSLRALLASLDYAIRLRQMRKMSLGDSLVAATTIVRHLTLATHNTSDFSWIAGLALIDPMT